MRVWNNELKNKTINYDLLKKYGFEYNDGKYTLKSKILNGDYEVVIEVVDDMIFSKVIDTNFQEEYVLVDIEYAQGQFVGYIKSAYQQIINDVVQSCLSYNVFQSKQSWQVISYIKEKYQSDAEYLWDKFPNNAVFKNKNQKWYGAILTVKESKINGNSNQEIEVIDLRYQKDDIEQIVDFKYIFPGYHMNKKSWITIKLDGSVNIKKIYELIDNSYKLSYRK